MGRRNHTKDKGHTALADDDLGELIRWSLAESVGGVEPSADVWPKILNQIKAMDACPTLQRQRRRVLLPLASFIQAVVISALLLAFGLEVNRNVPLSQKAYQVSATATMPKVSAPVESDQDMLRGYMLLQKGKLLLSRSHRGERLAEVQKSW
ncbi:MAG: hypothetical protein QXP01_03890 [Candidatus Hadarchaeum sp.]